MNWKFWKRKKIVQELKHPCSSDSCLVRAACTQACEKIIMDDKTLMEEFLKYNSCADCGCESFREGPCGGAAQNVKCNGCGHWFNFGLPLFIQRIHISEDGRFYD
ncbi:MAG TPA: hypothetical protein VMX17_08515 [Candidatus Glassbacteria bacterium]|nr:hypothetical protein [Candidatus Glassbacteria bacterium]